MEIDMDWVINFWQAAGGGVFAVACLVVAVRWLDRQRDEVLKALSQERMDRIKQLEEAAAHCRDDRSKLHQQLDALQAEFRNYVISQSQQPQRTHP